MIFGVWAMATVECVFALGAGLVIISSSACSTDEARRLA
jgi:hypothetical protein